MSTSNNRNESSLEIRNISAEEFQRDDRLVSYNTLIDVDLIAVSNRNLCYETVRDEFYKFSVFITQPFYSDYFQNLLTPVFLHLYLLLWNNNGKYEAESFFRTFDYLPISFEVLANLTQCETCREVEDFIRSNSKIRIQLSRSAYTCLMNWFMEEGFSATSKMFNILRVLHENFDLDVYDIPNPEDDDFVSEKMIYNEVESWFEGVFGPKKKKSETKVITGTCIISEYDDSEDLAEMNFEPKAKAGPQISEYDDAPLEVLTKKKSEPEAIAGPSKISEYDDSLMEDLGEMDFELKDIAGPFNISEYDDSLMADLAEMNSEPEAIAGPSKVSEYDDAHLEYLTKKKSEPEAIAEPTKISENDATPLEELTRKMSEFNAGLRAFRTAKGIGISIDLVSLLFSSYAETDSEDEEEQKKSEPETRRRRKKYRNKLNFEFESSMFKMKDTARRYFNQVKNSGLNMEEMAEALLNPADMGSGDFPDEFPLTTKKDGQKKKVNEYPGSMSDEVSEKSVERYFLEDPRSLADESAGEQKMDISEDTGSVAALSVDSSPLDQATVSPEDSEYLICSEASTEKNDEDENQAQENVDDQDLNNVITGSEENGTLSQKNVECADQDMKGNENGDAQAQENVECVDQDMKDGNEEGNAQAQENVECVDQDMKDGNEKGNAQAQENVECTDQDMKDGNKDVVRALENVDRANQDMNDCTIEGAQNEEPLDDIIHNSVEFKKAYKTNFHAVYPISISGKDIVCSSDMSPDMHYMAIGFESCKICTWRLGENNVTFQRIGTLKEHKGIVYAISIDPQKKVLISGSHDCTVRVWDIERSRCIRIIKAHSAPVYDVCVSPNSMYFVSASEDRQICLFWYDDISPMRVFSGHSLEATNRVQFHLNSAYFACACADGKLFLFNVNDDSRPVRMYHKHVAKVYTLSFSPCGKFLASADVEGVIIIWDVIKYKPIKIFETGQGIRSISYDKSGSFLAVLFYFKNWKVYNIEKDNNETVIEATSVGIPKAAYFCPDNRMLLIQFVEATEEEISEMKGKPKTTLRVVN